MRTLIDNLNIGQQGECQITRIGSLPEGTKTIEVERSSTGAFIISHSEKGNHHVVPDGEVMERINDVPAGMRILYAIVRDPTVIRQEASVSHDEIQLPPGTYEFRISREYDPFAEQARIVAD